MCTCLERDIFVARRYRTSVMEIPDENRERHKCHGNCEGARRDRRGILYSSPGVGLRQVVWHIFIFCFRFFFSFLSLSLTTLFPFVFLASIAPRFLFARTRRGTTREVGQGKSFGGFFLSCARKNTRDERRASAWSFYRGVHTVHTIQLGV